MWYAFTMGKLKYGNIKKYINCIIVISLTAASVSWLSPEPMVAGATTIGEVQENINKRQNEINEINRQIASFEDE